MRIVDAQLARAVGELHAEGQLNENELISAFVQFLRRKRLTRRTGKISRALEAYVTTVSGTERVIATTSRPLDPTWQGHITAAAARLLGKPDEKVALEFREDATLIGGLRLETVDTRYDCSVARALRELHKLL
ncbi:MAG: F0F1 ATP synthase subunit delta [Candidatus Moraniibacteriota bacterium]